MWKICKGICPKIPSRTFWLALHTTHSELTEHLSKTDMSTEIIPLVEFFFFRLANYKIDLFNSNLPSAQEFVQKFLLILLVSTTYHTHSELTEHLSKTDMS